MALSRVLGLAALPILLALVGLCRCASGGAQPEPDGTATSAASTSAPAPEPAPEESPAPTLVESTAQPPASVTATVPGLAGRVDFAEHVLPLLHQKCSPCHFQGGRMYGRLPFDQEGTIRVLGTQMFSRLRDPLDQELIRAYLEQP